MKTTFRLSKGDYRGRVLANAISFISELPEEKEWRVTIERYRKPRTDKQNDYHWAVVIKILSDAMGYEGEDVHEFLCGTHFGWVEKRVPKSPNFPSGIQVVPRRTTTRDENGQPSKLTTTQFSDFVEFCQRFAASKGIYIPDPEQSWQTN